MSRVMLVFLALMMFMVAPQALTSSCQRYEASERIADLGGSSCHLQTVYHWTGEMSQTAVDFLARIAQPLALLLCCLGFLPMLGVPFPKRVFLRPILPPPRFV